MKGPKPADYYDAALNDWLPGAIRRTDRGGVGGLIVDLPCRHCGLIEKVFHSANRMPPEKISRVLKTRGWTIGNRANKHECPVHTSYHANDQAKELPMPANDAPPPRTISPMRAAPIPPPPVPAPAVPTHDARAARREAWEWLNEGFDPEAGRFKPGINDATIAKETGLSEEAIAAIRDENFGPLKEPEEIAELRKELGELEADMQKALGEMTEIANGVSRMGERIMAFNTRLSDLSRKNGW